MNGITIPLVRSTRILLSQRKTILYARGIYESWKNPETGTPMETFSIVTTEANPRMEFIHNSKKRVPLILNENDSKLWLNQELPFAEKKKLIMPYPEVLISDHTIGKLITSRKRIQINRQLKLKLSTQN